MKKLRGFTLVELIIVMAIIGIIMAGAMGLFKPIREAFVDSTTYENTRTVESGIANYITGTTRYAVCLGIYENNETVAITKSTGTTIQVTVSNPQNAINAFVKSQMGFGEATSGSPELTAQQNYMKTFKVITINDKTAYTYKNKEYTGRLKMYKYKKPSSPTSIGTFNEYVAMGEGYYGADSYTVAIPASSIKSNGFEMTVSKQVAAGTPVVATNDSVMFLNSNVGNDSVHFSLKAVEPSKKYYIVYSTSEYKKPKT